MTSSPECILRIKTVMQRAGLSLATIYRRIEDGTFPGQICISTNCAGWYSSAIDRWIANLDAFHGLDNA